MGVLEIQELEADVVKMVFDGLDLPSRSLPTLSSKAREDLTWYFNEYATTSPYTSDRAIKASDHLLKYAFAIYEELALAFLNNYADPDEDLYIDIVDNGRPTSGFHSIPWECLESNSLELTKKWKNVIISRKVAPLECTISKFTEIETPDPSRFNILLVISRKCNTRISDISSDIAYHNVAPQFLHITEKVPNVNVDVARPGTFKALKAILESKPPKYYGLVHFDVHGRILEEAEGSKRCSMIISQHADKIFTDNTKSRLLGLLTRHR
jgi:hypothetical protein